MPITCPKCLSDQIHAGKKGFSGKNAVAGAILTGGVGLLAGTIGSNKIVITCLSCGHEWQPPIYKRVPGKAEKKVAKVLLWVLIVMVVFFGLVGLIAYLHS